jgi:lipid A 3-O-deacylase
VAASLSLLLLASPSAHAQERPSNSILDHTPLEYGLFAQGGVGLTEDRDSFRFMMAGAQAGKVLTQPAGPGILRGTFEYGVQVIPFWQSYTPTFQRNNCVTLTSGAISCSAPFTAGGTFTGVSVTPILLKWNLATGKKIVPWLQGGGGVIWTNHKYPAYGGPPAFVTGSGSSSTTTGGSLADNSINADTSVWNFTPQFGVGAHYFTRPNRSIDFTANAIHISSASIGDKNPGVNASVQFSLGYSWWK